MIRDPYWSDSAPGVREACEGALEALRAEVGGDVTEVELPDLELILPAALLVAQSEEAAHLVPGRASTSSSPELGLINRGVLKLRALLAAQPDRARVHAPRQGAQRTSPPSSTRSTCWPGRRSRPLPLRSPSR